MILDIIICIYVCFSNCSSGGGLKSSTCTWSRSVRRRGHNLDLVVAHGDGLSDLEVFNTIDDCWTSLSSLPEHCGLDGVAIIGFRSKVRIKPSLNKTSEKKFSSNGVLWFENTYFSTGSKSIVQCAGYFSK